MFGIGILEFEGDKSLFDDVSLSNAFDYYCNCSTALRSFSMQTLQCLPPTLP
jgi:hypothetical protein